MYSLKSIAMEFRVSRRWRLSQRLTGAARDGKKHEDSWKLNIVLHHVWETIRKVRVSHGQSVGNSSNRWMCAGEAGRWLCQIPSPWPRISRDSGILNFSLASQVRWDRFQVVSDAHHRIRGVPIFNAIKEFFFNNVTSRNFSRFCC